MVARSSRDDHVIIESCCIRRVCVAALIGVLTVTWDAMDEVQMVSVRYDQADPWDQTGQGGPERGR